MRERPAAWSRAWVAMWAVSSCVLIGAAFALPPEPWAGLATLLFGVPEAWALWRRGDRYPPLTFVATHYLPRWAKAGAIGFLTGAVGASWLGFERRWLLGLLLGLHSWALDHFAVTHQTISRWRTDAHDTA